MATAPITLAKLSLLGAALLGLTLGCASGEDETTGAGPTSTSSSGSGASSAGGAGVGGSGSGGSSVGGSGGSGGSPGGVLFPLAVGKSWTLQTTSMGNGGICGAGSQTMQVLSNNPDLDGRDAYELDSWCIGVSATSWYSPGQGDEVFFHFNNAWELSLHGTVQEGQSWTFQGLAYQWHGEGSVTVPAGSFQDCWTAQSTTSSQQPTYCRGVGLVRVVSNDGMGNGYTAVLTAYQ